MGSASLALSACDKPVEVGAYDNVEQCTLEGRYSTEQCEGAFAEARKQHLYDAPRYTTRQECESEFGPNRCQSLTDAAKDTVNPPPANTPPTQATTGTNWFVPFMMGYMVSNLMGGGQGYATQPLYRPRTGGYYTSSGRYVGAQPGRVSVDAATLNRPAPAVQQQQAQVRRGGFGSSSRSFGSAST